MVLAERALQGQGAGPPRRQQPHLLQAAPREVAQVAGDLGGGRGGGGGWALGWVGGSG